MNTVVDTNRREHLRTERRHVDVLPQEKKIYQPKSRTPDLIDLHLNGLRDPAVNLDADFWKGPTNNQMLNLRRYLYRHGVKKFLPTIITGSKAETERKLRIIATHQEKHPNGAENMADIAGVHIEGGYISRKGSHDVKQITALGPQVVEDFGQKFPGLIKLWTICPLVDKDGEHVKSQRKHGITPSYGHSNANYDEAMEAFEKHGVKLVTHWGNCMPFFMKEPIEGDREKRSNLEPDFNREDPQAEDWEKLEANLSQDSELRARAGLAKAAYDRDDVYMMAICGSDAKCKTVAGDPTEGDYRDYHISPKLIRKLADKERLILVTDAVAEGSPHTSESSAQQGRGYKLIGGMSALDRHAWYNAIEIAGLKAQEVVRAAIELPGKVLQGLIG